MRDSKLKVRGTRGTGPVCGPDVTKYGGHTTCFSLETPEVLLVIDAGSGLQSLSRALPGNGQRKPIVFFFTHYHLDHISGLNLFAALLDQASTVEMYGAGWPGFDWKQQLPLLWQRPFWPQPGRSVWNPGMHDLEETGGNMKLHGIDISWCPIEHTDRCLAYRLALPGRTLVIAPDHEPADPEKNLLIDFAAGADVLVHDAQYTPDEYPAKRGWGHSTWREATTIAERAGVKELYLTHHDMARTDDMVDALVEEARMIFPQTRAAFEGLEL